MTKKINLFLDDLREGPNNDWGRGEAGWENWVVVRSVENAKWLLEMGVVHHLSLDHDMGYNSIDSSKENENGMVLVRWMVENSIWPSGDISIHSANIERALVMRETLNKYRPEDSKEVECEPDP